MPSSGWGMEEVTSSELEYFESCYKRAQEFTLEVEWLGCFISAIKKGADVREASLAGLIEWDIWPEEK